MNTTSPIMPGDHGWENNAVVRFYNQTILNEFKTYKDSTANPDRQPVFDSVEMVEVSFPGDNHTVLVRRVGAVDKATYPKTYEAFKENRGQAGMPLTNWDKCNPTDVALFHYHKIFTVEQLAGVNDGNIGNLGPTGHKLRTLALEFVAAQDVHARNAELRTHIALADERAKAADDRAAKLEKQMALLIERLGVAPQVEVAAATVETENPALEELRKKDISALTAEDQETLRKAPKPKALPPHMQSQG